VQRATDMKSAPTCTMHDLPLTEVRKRAAKARDVLREARTHAGRVGGLRAIDAALDEVEQLLPGLMDRPRASLARKVRDLAPYERGLLRRAIDVDGTARALMPRLVGEASLSEVEEVLARVEEQECVAVELMALLRVFEQAYCAPVLASA